MRTFFPALLLLSVWICSGAGPVKTGQVIHLKPARFLEQIRRRPDPRIIDLRDYDEYLYFHMEGAVNIEPATRDFLPEVREHFPAGDTLFIYCRMGKVKDVARLLLDNGYPVIYNLQGGMSAYEKYRRKADRALRKK